MTGIDTIRVQRYRFHAFDGSDVVAPVPQQPVQAVVAAAVREEAPPAPPPPVFSEQQLQQAKAAGYQEGFGAGRQEAEAKANKALLESAAAQQGVLEMIANCITLAGETHLQFLSSQKELLARAMLAIARKVAGDALRATPSATLDALLAQCVGVVAGSNRIIITVATAKSAGIKILQDKLKAQLGDFQGEIVINGDDTLGENDCRVEWKNGQAEYDHNAVWRDIESLIEKTLST